MKIGVFDSGLGGKYVADKLRELFPDDEVLYVNDRANLPYGAKTAGHICQLVTHAITPLLDASCDAIVIACNSATTNAIAHLRSTFPDVFFVGIEPMIKPAVAATKTGRIAVCATPATLQSDAYKKLLDAYAHDVEIIEPDCSTWAELIEKNQMSEIDLRETIQYLQRMNCDTIVLGCTHYHYLKETIHALAADVTILEPTDAIAQRLRSQLTAVRSRLQ